MNKKGRADLLLEQSWVPKPLLSPLEWSVAKALVADPRLQRNIPDQIIPLDQIEPTQHRLDRDKVSSLAAQGVCDGGLAFKRGGQVYLWDGHHRHFAAQEMGKEERTLKVLELTDQNTLDGDGKEGMSLRDWAGQLGIRVKSILRNMDHSDLQHLEYQDHHEG